MAVTPNQYWHELDKLLINPDEKRRRMRARFGERAANPVELSRLYADLMEVGVTWSTDFMLDRVRLSRGDRVTYVSRQLLASTDNPGELYRMIMRELTADDQHVYHQAGTFTMTTQQLDRIQA